FAESDATNPVIEGRLRRADCAQVTDGGAAIVLASARYTEAWARARDHAPAAFADANRRAGTALPALDGIEVHDCFTTTEYMAIDHLGLTPPGQSWQAIEDG